jgi:predicted unusual protein kinase regulating ubiquinone biosynthesis (AarF/ABC1/UbiB family)
VIEPVQKSAPRTDLKRRRAKVEQRLAAFDLIRGPRYLTRVRSVADNTAPRCRRLRFALEGLGPSFISFGRYLATRVDLLPAHERGELAAIADRAAAMPFASVRALFRRELGCLPEDACLAFAEEPFESRLFHQSHCAVLHDGSPVVVKLMRAEAGEQLWCDAQLLPLLGKVFVGEELSDSAFASAVVDFSGTLRQRTDFADAARALETLARDSEEFDMLRVPKLRRELSTSRVLTVERIEGTNLAELISSRGALADAMPDRNGEPIPSLRNVPRRLCTVWLRQALLGRTFPVELHPGDTLILPGNQIAFTGGVFAEPPTESQPRLLEYLIALATENPERACTHLLREMSPADRHDSEDGLRQQFKQFVPLRDDNWHHGGGSSQLATTLLAHWQLAPKCGYKPQPHLLAFYRGLSVLTEPARRLACEGDPLLEGLRDVRLLSGITQFREMMSLNQLGDQMDKYAVMMMEMPQRLDEVLSLVSGGGAPPRLSAQEAHARRRRKNSRAVFTALLLLFCSVALLLPQVTGEFLEGAWSNKVFVVVSVWFVAVLLRAFGQDG